MSPQPINIGDLFDLILDEIIENWALYNLLTLNLYASNVNGSARSSCTYRRQKSNNNATDKQRQKKSNNLSTNIGPTRPSVSLPTEWFKFKRIVYAFTIINRKILEKKTVCVDRRMAEIAPNTNSYKAIRESAVQHFSFLSMFSCWCRCALWWIQLLRNWWCKVHANNCHLFIGLFWTKIYIL